MPSLNMILSGRKNASVMTSDSFLQSKNWDFYLAPRAPRTEKESDAWAPHLLFMLHRRDLDRHSSRFRQSPSIGSEIPQRTDECRPRSLAYSLFRPIFLARLTRSDSKSEPTPSTLVTSIKSGTQLQCCLLSISSTSTPELVSYPVRILLSSPRESVLSFTSPFCHWFVRTTKSTSPWSCRVSLPSWHLPQV
jgi:hypothetical protein